MNFRDTFKLFAPLTNKILNETDILPTETSPTESENPYYREHLRLITARSEKVMSKSKKLIADLLFSYKLNYQYEVQLTMF